MSWKDGQTHLKLIRAKTHRHCLRTKCCIIKSNRLDVILGEESWLSMVGCYSWQFLAASIVSKLMCKLLFIRNTNASPCTEPVILAWRAMVPGTSLGMGTCPFSCQRLKRKQKVELLCFPAQNQLFWWLNPGCLLITLGCSHQSWRSEKVLA